MRSLAREESEESPEESDLKKLTSVTGLRNHRCLRPDQNRGRIRDGTEPGPGWVRDGGHSQRPRMHGAPVSQ